MKIKLYFLMICITLLGACSNNSKTPTTPNISEDSLNYTTDAPKTIDNTPVENPAEHIEYHPNGQVKIKGRMNKAGERHGLWVSYYDNGTKWSESYYVDGERDGHSLTFYPNGRVRYIGEYKNDIKVGNWKFYDEEGNLTKEENF